MPRPKINDYIFYKIVNVNGDVDLCYVGSTANWKHRASRHKSDCHYENSKIHNCKLYKTIREYGGWDEFKMVEIGRAEQLTKRQAEQKEEEYRIQLNAELNSQRCFRTKEQKKEYKKEYNKEYYADNDNKLKKYQKEYRADNANKDKIKEYIKQYYIENKDEINKKRNEKFTCECGGCYTHSKKARHLKTNKHQKYINSIQTDTSINPPPHLDTQLIL